MLSCQNLAARIESLQPLAAPRDVARLCLLMANHLEEAAESFDENQFGRTWEAMGMRLQAATDQHAAMTEELEGLAGLTPQQFGAEEVCVLIRAIKVQGQVLQLYVGHSESDE